MAACVAVIALGPGGAVADDSAPVVQATVYGANGQPTTDSVSPAALLANPGQCPPYSGGTLIEYGRTGPEPITPNTTRSWTLGTILRCLQTPIAPADVTGITVIGSDGQPQSGPNSQISPADLATPSDFLNSAQNPVVQSVGYNEYDRPQRNASDLDYLDELQQNDPIAIDVFEGPPLRVTASASPTTVTQGATIGFSAGVSGNNGSALSYTWSFDGGASPSTEASPQIQFNTAGVWAVNVEVTDAAGGGGGDQLTVTVKQPGSTTTPKQTGPRTTGPNKGNGPAPGAPATKQKQSGTANGGRHTHGKGTQTTTTQSQTTTTRTTTQSTTTTTPPSGGSSSAGSPSVTAPASPTTPTTAHTTPRAPTHRPSPKPPVSQSGTPVQGELISDVVPVPADRSPLVQVVSAPAAGAPAREAAEGPSVLPIVGAALAVLVLLGLGAQRELGRPRWWPAVHIGR